MLSTNFRKFSYTKYDFNKWTIMQQLFIFYLHTNYIYIFTKNINNIGEGSGLWGENTKSLE